jgi:hypothetical protein
MHADLIAAENVATSLNPLLMVRARTAARRSAGRGVEAGSQLRLVRTRTYVLVQSVGLYTRCLYTCMHLRTYMELIYHVIS